MCQKKAQTAGLAAAIPIIKQRCPDKALVILVESHKEGREALAAGADYYRLWPRTKTPGNQAPKP
jgi:hypothetical protein